MKKNKLLLTTWAISLATALGAMAQVNITTWQVDTQHTGANLNETVLTPALVSSPGNFGLLFSQQMDGQCYTQPLYVSGLSIGGVTHNVVYLETEHDTMYAFDADNNTGSNASPLWSKSFLTAGVNTPPPQGDVGSGDISEELGNTATPVIDVTGGTIYCLSKVKVTATGAYQQYLHALDLKTGAEKFGGPVLINPTFAGSANDGTGGVIPFSPLHSHDRAALTFYNGIVYIMYASHSDTQPYHGEILGYNSTTLALTKTFITTPNGNEAGLWQGGANAAIDSAGNMFVAVANGDWDQKTSPYTTGTDWGESFLKLPTTGAFTVSFSNPLNWFTPYNWGNNPGELNNGDLDLGSSGVTLLPDQVGGTHPHLLVGGGKGGTLYVIDRDNMGGNLAPTAGHNNSVQEITETNSMFVTPAYFNGNIYYAAAGGKMTQRAVGYNATDGTYISTSAVKSNFTYNGGHGSGAFISANGNTNGILWTLDLGGPAHLQAYNAANIAGDPIYSGAAVLPAGNISVSGPKFALPTVVNGKAYFSGYVYTAATNTSVGYLLVFGQPPAVVGTPPPASGLTTTAISSSQIVLNWVDNSTNESGFKVNRATALAGPYTTLTPTPSAGANVTTFTDTGLTPGTTYYYQVIATNANGDSTPTIVSSAKTFPTYVENGLVAYWSMDESTGSTSTDLTGNGHLGTWEGEQTPDVGYINGSHWFHGTGAVASRISVPNKADLQFTASQSFTLAAWVKPAALRSSPESVIAKSRDTGNYYGISINAANNWVARGPVSDVTGPAATQDVWTHVAVIQDGAAGTRKLYINGALAASGSAQAADGTGALWISQANSGGGTVIEAFPGNIDEVRIYNRALAASELAPLQSAPILQATSLQTQGAASYQLVIAPSSTKVVESRKGSTAGRYNLVLSFSAPVSGITATLGLQGGGSATGSINSVTYDSTGKVVTVVLTGVANAQKLNLHLAGITPGNGTEDIPFNVLWGDVNGDNKVDSLDASIVAHNHTSAVNGTSFVDDINCDGAVDGTDDTLVTGAAGTNIGAQTDSNIAIYKTASASTTNGTNLPANAFDGNLTTRWESASTDPQTITVDLGSISTIHGITLYWETAAGKTYTVDSSNDNSTWTNLVTETAGTSGATKSYTAPAGSSGRYVRMNGTTRTTGFGYSLWEFQVLGIPGVTTTPTITSALTKAGTVGTALTYNITATNSPTSYSATPLPPGLTLNATTGAITGTPTTAGTTNTTITATNGSGAGSPATLVFTIGASGAVPVINSALTQAGTVGTALTYNITATNAPTSYGATPLPPGLTLNATTGAITGTPTTAGTTNTTITATNGTGTSTPATLVFTIGAGGGGGVPVINSALTASATVGGAFSYQIGATNTPTSYNATNLPSGLVVSTVTGAITGYPNAAGTANVSITATNASGTSTAATLVITTSAGTDTNLAQGMTTTTSSVTGANTGAMAVDGNTGTRWESLYTDTEYIYVDLGATKNIHSVIINWETAAGKNYTIQSSNDLATWTDLVTPVTGNTTGGIHAYTGLTGSGRYVRIAGTLRATQYGYSIWELQVFGNTSGGAVPVINSALTQTGTVGTALTYNITATNTPTSYSATPLPPGLTLNATTGAITGTPTTAGTTNTTITATNGSGTSSPATLVFTVNAAGAVPVITSALTQSGTVGTALTYTITATNTPTSYSATPLPPGLSLNIATGAITGSPTVAGTTNTTITATNGTGTSSPATLVFTIGAAGSVPVINSALTQSATVGGAVNYQITATNAPTSYNATNLPSGLIVSTVTGAITGYPNAPGTANVSITATNASGTSTAATLVITTSASTDINLALSKTTTTSSVTGANTGSLAVDGNSGTRWESLYTDNEYIYVDLGAVQTIHSVIINWETAAGKNYTIQSSNDLSTWTDLVTPVTGNTTAGIHAYTGLTGSGRYVRIAGTLRATAYGYSIYELQVFGVSAVDTNIAQGATSTASSFQAGNLVANGNDGSTATRWAASDGTFPQWWKVDLGASKTLSRVDIAWYSSATRYYKYKIETSTNDTTYTLYKDNTANTTFGDTSDAGVATARYVKITLNGASAGFGSAYEFKVYGH